MVATLLAEFPGCLPPYCSKLLEHAPDCFDDLRLATVALAIRQLRDVGKPIAPLTVHEHLQDENKLDDAGGAVFVDNLASQAIGLSIAEFEAADVWTSYRTRRLKSVYSEAAAAMEAAPSQADSIVAGVRHALETLDNEQTNGALPDMEDAAAFVAQEFAEPPQLIRGILHQGSKLVLGGGSKSFKTWCLLDLALSVGHGQPWLSFDTVQGRVLYVNFEIPSWSWQNRIQAVARAKSIEIKPGSMSLWNLRGKAANFELLLPRVQKLVKQEFALIILDPIYKLYGHADENKAGDVARLLNGIEGLAVASGAAVAFGAHFSKGNQAGKESLDRISGSGVFARDPDSLLVFTKHEEEGAFTVEPTLRNFRPVEPFAVRWQFPLMTQDKSLDPARLKRVGGRKRQRGPGDLWKLLGKQALSTRKWQALALRRRKIRRRTFYTLRKELEETGRIRKSEVNDKWTQVQ